MAYRPTDGIEIFPSYVLPDEVKVDEYGTFLLVYNEHDKFETDYAELEKDKNTAFVYAISQDDIVVDDVEFTAESDTMSYAPTMMNSREYASKLIGTDKQLTVVVMDTGLFSENSKVIPHINLKDSYDFVNGDNNVFDKRDSHATYVSSVILDMLGSELYSNINLINAKTL